MRRCVVSMLGAGLIACGPAGSTSGTIDRPASPRLKNPDAGLTAPAADAEVAPPPPPEDAGVAPPRPDASAPRPTFPDASVPPPNMCTDGPNKPRPASYKIFYGTDLPQHVPLSTAQINAVGNFDGCSGAFIAPTWILSATHCGHRRGARFCIGQDPTSEDACFTATRVVDNPQGDMTLLEIGEDATVRAPWMAPVPILADDMDRTWVGVTAEAAGYGQQETGRDGRREFTAEPISSVSGDTVTINGEGRHGVCFGDSGGPLFAVGSDGSARVAGTLSNGDSSCTGYDNFTRTDVYRAWIEGYVGPSVPPGPRPCVAVTAEGSCSTDGARATWCDMGELRVETCSGTTICGFDTAAQGSRCIDRSADACAGLTYAGRCAGNTLEWCERGVRLTRSCQSCGETCLPMRDGTGSFCIPSNCGDLTFEGRCEGNTAVWCNRDGERETRNCSRGCAYIDAATGYFCR